MKKNGGQMKSGENWMSSAVKGYNSVILGKTWIRLKRYCSRRARILLASVAAAFILLAVMYTIIGRSGCTPATPLDTLIGSSTDSDILLDVAPLLDAEVPLDGSIFMLETMARQNLMSRVCCALESAARYNPDQLLVLLTAAEQLRNTGCLPQLMTNKRLLVRQLNLTQLFEGMPLDSWYKSGGLDGSAFPVHHAADALRWVLLHRYGGIYMDTDTITAKSLSALDYGTSVDEGRIQAGVLKFRRDSKITHRFLTKFSEIYSPSEWSLGSVSVIEEVIGADCHMEAPYRPTKCNGYTVYTDEYFYPLPWHQWQQYLDPELASSVMKRVQNSHVIHTWGALTRNCQAPGDSALAVLALTHCPATLEIFKSHF